VNSTPGLNTNYFSIANMPNWYTRPLRRDPQSVSWFAHKVSWLQCQRRDTFVKLQILYRKTAYSLPNVV